MSPAALPQYAAYAAIAVFIIYRQLAPRQAQNTGGLFILPVVLTGFGVYAMLQSPPAGGATYLLLTGELALGAVAGVARALTIRFWTDQRGVLMQRGTWLTLVIWVLFIVLRMGSYLLVGGALGTPALTLSVGASLLVQAGVTYLRREALSRHLEPQPQCQGLYR